MARGWLNHRILKPAEYSRGEAWAWLIEAAAYQPTEIVVAGELVRLRRGQLTHSIRHMAKEWGWSIGRVQRFMALLSQESMIDTSSDTRSTVITICNYGKYQFSPSGSDTTTDTGRDRFKNDSPIDSNSDTQNRSNPAVFGSKPIQNRVGPRAEIDSKINNKQDLSPVADATGSRKRTRTRDERQTNLYLPIDGTQAKLERTAHGSSGKTWLSADWQPGAADWQHAADRGHSDFWIAEQADAFRDYWLARGEACADWHARWRTWIRKAEEFAERDTRNGARTNGHAAVGRAQSGSIHAAIHAVVHRRNVG
jgi:hypothetical protein